MNLQVTNCGVNVGSIRIVGVSSSSVFLIGDTNEISLASAFDTPPESLIIGPNIVPLSPETAPEEIVSPAPGEAVSVAEPEIESGTEPAA